MLGGTGLAFSAYFLFRRKPKSAEELERKRREWLDQVGRITDGTVIDHIAFSFSDIKPVFRRMQQAGVVIVFPIAKSPEYGLTSFFVRGPDGLLVEVVEELPVPEGIWQAKP